MSTATPRPGCSPATRQAGLRRNRPYSAIENSFSAALCASYLPRIAKSGMAQCGLATIIESWLSSV